MPEVVTRLQAAPAERYPVRDPYRTYWTMSRDRMFVLLQESDSDVWIVATGEM